MPFAAAQIGLAFRNEISPRAGLLRVREFPLAEIEHFCHPNDKDHPKFKTLAHTSMNLIPRDLQDGALDYAVMTIGEAVKTGVVANETLGYFMARTQMFLHTAGIIPERLRFRQHLANEMAHYAADCWDAEIFMSCYGWIECVGHADRAAFDLQVHSAASKIEMTAQKMYETPKIVESTVVKPIFPRLAKKYKKELPLIVKYLSELSSEDALKFAADLNNGPVTVKLCAGNFEVEKDMVDIKKQTVKISVDKYTPSVIEPSFGIGRIMYGILDHSFTVKTKKDKTQVAILQLSTAIAPVKCGIIMVATSKEAFAISEFLESNFIEDGLASKTDSSGVSVGKKYARMDEVGVPYCVTIDFEYDSITIRDRDTTTQVRVKKEDALEIITDLIRGFTTWEEVRKTYTNFGDANAE